MRNLDSHTIISRPLTLLCAMALLLGACSSGSDSATGEEDETATTAEASETNDATSGDSDPAPEPADDSANSDYDCDALGEYALTLRQANGWLPQVMAQESTEILEALGGDLDGLDAAIEGLRPIQDIDGVLGAPREGLDNMAADIAAVRAETYGESAGSYKIAAVSAVLGEEICQ